MCKQTYQFSSRVNIDDQDYLKWNKKNPSEPPEPSTFHLLFIFEHLYMYTTFKWFDLECISSRKSLKLTQKLLESPSIV